MSATARLDFDAIKRAAIASLPSLLPRWLPGGVQRGREWRTGGIGGERGDSLGVNLDTGLWADFNPADGGRGDVLDLYAAVHRCTKGDAARRLADELALSSRPAANVMPMPKRDFTAILPPPADAPAPPREHPKHGAPEHVAEVRDQAGALLYFILRFPPRGDVRKQVCPLTFGTLDGRTSWHWKAPPAPRPLYGLPLRPGVPVIVVEGEMKRDAAQRLVGEAAAVVSWPNGADGVGKADWRPLSGRDVVVWPDADPAGLRAAASVVNVLRGVANARAVAPPHGAADGWDLADAEREGWTGASVLDHIAAFSEPDELPRPPPRSDGGDGGDEWPFRCLGHDRGEYHILPREGGQVMRLRGRDLTSHASLLMLAPLRWWEGAFPGRESFNARLAGDAIMRACGRAGVFDADRMRGRGVWLDEGRTVIHLGDRLLVDGEEHAPASFPSRYIYEVSRPLAVPMPPPASSREASGLLRLCCEVAWEDRDRDGRLLAGWIVAAMVCGAMPWRPHLWITSEAGGGKSWVMANIIRPMLADLALSVQGKTTEAGLRGMLRLDARPVVFDEAETQNEADRARMQQVLDLARAASSEDGAEVVKGTREGGAVRYRIRSCFAFSSINLGVTQAADESRIITLTLAPAADAGDRAAAFDALRSLHREVMVPGIGAAILTRTLGLLPTIRHNADVLAAAIARGGTSRRTGDTLGVVLACAYSLASGQRLDAGAADEWLAARTWVREAAASREGEPEWRRALLRLVQTEVRFTNHNGRLEALTVSELIGACSHGDDAIRHDDADKALRRAGMVVKSDELRIANRSEGATKAFAGTEWATGWRSTLARAPGARRDVATRFSPAVMDKAVCLPLDTMLERPP
jgi:putative DNA primase/helicase